MADVEGLSQDLAIKFFEKVAYPQATEAYQVDHALDLSNDAPDEPLIVDLIIKSITDLQIPIPQVMVTTVN